MSIIQGDIKLDGFYSGRYKAEKVISQETARRCIGCGKMQRMQGVAE